MSRGETFSATAPQALEREQLLLSRRLRSFGRSSALSVLPSLASVAILAWLFLGDIPDAALAGWAAVIVAVIGARLLVWPRIDSESDDLARLRRHWREVNVILLIGSAAWGAIFPLAGYYGEGLEFAVLAIIGTAIFNSVLLMHRPAPQAAMMHLLLVGSGLAVAAWLIAGAAAWPALVLILVYALTLLGATRVQERQFQSAATAELLRRDADATVRMLLNDYEEQSSDWLWTCGPRGNLRDVSPRFARALGRECEMLEGTRFLDLFERAPERAVLAGHLEDRSAFRDLLLTLRIGDELRYWRLSARPRSNGRMNGVCRDVTQNQLTEQRVAFMAHFDNLTGLANRYLFNERLRGSLAGNRGERHVALFYLDLDDFKSINDTRGHLVGDRLLREVGARLEQEVRAEDLVARLGGDEFAILVETRAGASLLIEHAHRFLNAVREPLEIEGQRYRISTSVGVARCRAGECDAEELMRRADLALFAAKAKGRDQLAIYDHSLDRAARERRAIESDLREAVPGNQLRLHYQPVIDLDNGATTGYEALLRWHHPVRGIIGPVDFLTIAEETGLIVPIGEWVIRQALTETASWRGDIRIAINLSPTQVASPHLVAMVAQALHHTGVPPDSVEFEITEHVLMQEGEASRNTLFKLRELGVRIALDDFGIGYSSLSYLRRFPFDRIKIDRHFVEGIESNAANQAIVASITGLADALGIATTAEGIENRRQLDMLRELGCHEAQGFLICKPVPGETFAGDGREATEPAVLGSAVLDYRKAREAALKRKGSRVA